MEFSEVRKAGRAFFPGRSARLLERCPRGSTVAVCVGGAHDSLGGVAISAARPLRNAISATAASWAAFGRCRLARHAASWAMTACTSSGRRRARLTEIVAPALVSDHDGGRGLGVLQNGGGVGRVPGSRATVSATQSWRNPDECMSDHSSNPPELLGDGAPG